MSLPAGGAGHDHDPGRDVTQPPPPPVVVGVATEPPVDGADRAPHRVVIVGSGFGGLFATRALRTAPVEITLIDRTNHHLFQPLLYQVATGILPEGEIAPAIRDVLRRYPHVQVQLAEVTGIDLERRVVVAIQPGRVIETPYDSLIVAAGVETTYFGHDELSQWAPGMKSIDDALELRGRIFDAFEMAETEPDPEARRSWLTFVVVGGGPTGVEMAGQIIELADRALRGNFRAIDPASARVVLVEGTDRVLPTFGARLSEMTRHDLVGLGIEVRTGCLVTTMDDETVELRRSDGHTERINARTKIWAAGMTASPLARMLAEAAGAEVDRMGRIKVLPDCTVPGHPEVFAVGDMMALDDLPGLAEVAIQAGVHAARVIRQRLDGDDTPRKFHYHDLGTLATISRFRAVARFHRVSVGGFVGWVLWLVVHLTFLTGFKNRLAALAHWAIAFIGRGRAERVITRQQIEARQAIAAARAKDGTRPVSSHDEIARAAAPDAAGPTDSPAPDEGPGSPTSQEGAPAARSGPAA
jgi:NADH:ubiquinone reductase (H+-translocating)